MSCELLTRRHEANALCGFSVNHKRLRHKRLPRPLRHLVRVAMTKRGAGHTVDKAAKRDPREAAWYELQHSRQAQHSRSIVAAGLLTSVRQVVRERGAPQGGLMQVCMVIKQPHHKRG